MSAILVTDPKELAELFLVDRELHIYALADLEEPYWSSSSWWRTGDAVVGLVGLPDDEGDIVYAVSTQDPAGTLDLLTSLTDKIAPGSLITGPVGLADVLNQQGRLDWHRTYRRYVLTETPAEDVGVRSSEVLALGLDDAEELDDLYGRDPGAAFFRRSMLRNQTFCGIRRDGVLVAAAGAHVLAEGYRVAAIGAVITDPEWRGNGFAGAVTLGVIRRLNSRVDVIGLNCAEPNTAAQRVWHQCGFRPSLSYEEAQFAQIA